ncbi:MAG: hypothetical protein AAF211_20035, partial [Myxococcota bacterium]
WGRLTHLDAEGNVLHAQALGFDRPIRGGIGGAAHLVATGSWAAVIWGDEGVVYKTRPGDWTETARFEVTDGVPRGAVTWGGRLGLVFGTDVVLYGRDGFRYGKVEGLDFLNGAENWGITLDDKGRLWGVLDNGDVVQFTTSGKLKRRVTIDEYGFDMPRLAISDDLAFISTEDRIIQADLREIEAEEGLEPERDLLQVEPK